MAFCELCELSSCIHTLGKPAEIDIPEPEVDGPTINARHDGFCEHCMQRVEQNDSITHTDIGWVLTDHLHTKPTQIQASDFEDLM